MKFSPLFVDNTRKNTNFAALFFILRKREHLNMKNILIIGSTGQIGSELTLELRKRYPQGAVVAGYIRGAEPQGALLESGPAALADITDDRQIADVVTQYNIDTIYNLAALLSKVAEEKPQLAWKIGVGGLFNVLEVAREKRCAVFTPSSIGAFGPDTPKDKTPQDTVRNPQTMYGITKVSGELLSNYYFRRFGVDTRSVRFPGIISYTTLPGGGTTDYAVDIFYSAVSGKKFVCPIAAGTFMDMMYMPDALNAAIQLMEADPAKLKHRNAFNITAMSFDPEILSAQIRKYMPAFRMEYNINPVIQSIAESWPNSLDDTCARREWGWNPKYDLDAMTKDMLEHLKIKLSNARTTA
jgi:nucleoside-diphosphate-sugar epimerase